jgi:hypothetical protein
MHQNPGHWHLIFLYIAPEDPRIVVRKRLGIMGWTLNFARPMAIPFLVALIAGSYGYIQILGRMKLTDPGKWAGVFLLLALIVSLCGWMSDPRRFATR